MTQSTTPASWYPDPQNPSQLRYWDGNGWTDQFRAATGGAPVQSQHMAESAPGSLNAPLASYQGPPIIITTMNDLPGWEIAEVYGEVFGVVVRARNAFSNMGAGFRTVFGGEAKGFTKLITDSRLEATARLRAAAHDVGGNAVIAMRFDCNEIAGQMSEVAAYGTAVRAVRKP